jgi:competence protein ComEC
MKRHWQIILVALLWCSSTAVCLEPGPRDLFVRVIDTGPAECCVVVIPAAQPEGTPSYLIYDAGNYVDGGKLAIQKIQELIQPGSEVALMVLSHTDSDHLGAVPQICHDYKVRRIIWAGYKRTTSVWADAEKAIKEEVATDGCQEINLSKACLQEGKVYSIGEAKVQLVCGFCQPPKDWGKMTPAMQMNAGSIVIRVIYKGKAILFCGDDVGRKEDDTPNAPPIATEKYMLANRDTINIAANVMIAPHHGADNASSTAFITAVHPEYVIFSAGHMPTFCHPRATTAQRYLDCGVKLQNMFRTDLGDDDGEKEWSFGRIPGHHDPAGDDDVDIAINPEGKVQVEYRSEQNQKYHDKISKASTN